VSLEALPSPPGNPGEIYVTVVEVAGPLFRTHRLPGEFQRQRGLAGAGFAMQKEYTGLFHQRRVQALKVSPRPTKSLGS